MRQRRKEERQKATVTRGYQAAGDAAMERFAYTEAATHYQRALAQLPPAEDEVRLCVKTGIAIFRNTRPDFATPWFERALDKSLAAPLLRERAPDLLTWIPSQRWIESRTKEAIPYFDRAIELMPRKDPAFVSEMETLAAAYLSTIGRYQESAVRFSRAFPPDASVGAIVRANYWSCRAILHAARGNARRAFADFDRAVEAAMELPDGYTATLTWEDYADWALALGKITIARTCIERALLVARERRIMWRVPYLTLRFASILTTCGDYDHAKDMLADATTYDTEAPIVHVLKIRITFELARARNDDALLSRALADDRAMEFAMASGEPQTIAPLAAAYVQAMAPHRVARAKRLISRALDAIESADHTGGFLALVARYGSNEETVRARKLLERRVHSPNHHVAHAYLELFNAHAALRSQKAAIAEKHTRTAARAFERLGWKYHQMQALGLVDSRRSTREYPSSSALLAGAHDLGLTDRERQVAELVLRGLTNRAVAETLSISEHTVEAHMTSIFNRLGLRSRWQLIDKLH